MKDIVIVGGGIAGLSVAAKLAPFASVAVLEREPQLGYHSSGRSATMFHNAMGSHLVRALSAYSEPFFKDAGDFSVVPLSSPRPGLFVMGAEKAEALRQFFAEMQRVTNDVEMIGADHIHELVPVLRTDAVHFPKRFSITAGGGSTATRCCKAMRGRRAAMARRFSAITA